MRPTIRTQFEQQPDGQSRSKEGGSCVDLARMDSHANTSPPGARSLDGSGGPEPARPTRGRPPPGRVRTAASGRCIDSPSARSWLRLRTARQVVDDRQATSTRRYMFAFWRLLAQDFLIIDSPAGATR